MITTVAERLPEGGASKIRHQVVTVTPERAKEWLAKSNPLHRVNTRSVTNYAYAMTHRRWKVSGEPIIFSDEDHLLDGHARLKACVESNMPFGTLVIWNVPTASFVTTDAVRKRTLGDILHIRREPNGRQLAAALMVIWRHRHDDLASQKKQPSTGELLAILDAHPSIRDISLKVALDAAPDLPLGTGTALHHLCSLADPEKANEFFQQFVDSPPEAPGAILRAALRDMASQGGRRLQPMVFALAVKAWNAFYDDKPITFVRYTQDREKFPQIEGLEQTADDHFDDEIEPIEAAASPSSTAGTDDANSGITVEIVNVTPADAAALLEKNDGNRLIAAGVVAKYKRDMISGKWMLNGQTIKIGKSGRLLDGQHRCLASIQSGATFQAIIVRNVDDGVFDTLDLGGRRSFSDVLSQRGEKSTAALAAALKWIWLYEEQKIFDRVIAPTNSELDQLLAQNPALRESVKLANKMKVVVAPGMGVALHHMFSAIDSTEASEFFDRLCDGQNLNKDNPVWHLRERFIKDRSERKVRMAEGERFVLAVKAWNATRQGKKITNLSWRGKGPSREAVPAIV
jgi:hypothetical protein